MSLPVKSGQVLELHIDRLSFTGQGIARFDNFVVFVPDTLPGDRIRAAILRTKRRYAEGQVVEYLARSEQYVVPSCRHFEQCGGCSLQNLQYERQLSAKAEAVREHLRRIGKIEHPPMAAIVPSQAIFHYRNKMEFSFTPDAEQGLALGLHTRGRWERIFDVEECLLQSELSNRIVTAVRDFFRSAGVAPYDCLNHSGWLRFLILRESQSTGEMMLILVSHQGEFVHEQEFVELLSARFPQLVSVVRIINSTKANIARGESEQLLWGQEYITEQIGKRQYRIRPMTFFQTNSRQTVRLYDTVVELGEFAASDRVLDLYTGCGSIAIYLADRVRSVLGVELEPAAVSSATENAALNVVDNCEFEAGDVRLVLERLARDGRQFDKVIVDPPRAGIGSRVIRRLVRLQPRTLIYVSCNPTTLARDLQELLAAGYRLDLVVPVDMFPHTFHIESVSRLSLETVP